MNWSDRISHTLYNFFLDAGMSEASAETINMVILLIAIAIFIGLVDFSLRLALRRFFNQFAARTKTHFDDYLVKNKVPRNLAHIIPLFLAFKVSPIVFSDFKPYANYTDIALQVLGVILTLAIVRGLLKTLEDYFKTLPKLKDKPINSYIQVFTIFAWIVGVLSIFAILTGISFGKFVTGLGAASAVILLIFRDTILGFVASIQVSINDMVHIGDWITFEKYGADGDVIEINLATVKVQNFDKTITTIPTYALISDSFKNWRGMMNSDGRRIKRSVMIAQDSVHFLSTEEIEKLKQIQIIKAYLDKRQSDIDRFNEKHAADKTLAVNGRNMTNLGVFRKYLDSYLRQHSAINKDMTIMVRQLAPTPQGLPMEIYAFSSDKRWEQYEHIMSDIFDHIVAAVPYFNLELFEYPTENFQVNQSNS